MIQLTSEKPSNPLWPAFLHYYQLPEMEQALLHLQNEYDADVNLLLLCFWLTDSGNQWCDDFISREYFTWMQENLKPIRAIRQSLKQRPSVLAEQQKAFRQKLKQVELEAEKFLIDLLWQQLQSFDLVMIGDQVHDQMCKKGNEQLLMMNLQAMFACYRLKSEQLKIVDIKLSIKLDQQAGQKKDELENLARLLYTK